MLVLLAGLVTAHCKYGHPTRSPRFGFAAITNDKLIVGYACVWRKELCEASWSATILNETLPLVPLQRKNMESETKWRTAFFTANVRPLVIDKIVAQTPDGVTTWHNIDVCELPDVPRTPLAACTMITNRDTVGMNTLDPGTVRAWLKHYDHAGVDKFLIYLDVNKKENTTLLREELRRWNVEVVDWFFDQKRLTTQRLMENHCLHWSRTFTRQLVHCDVDEYFVPTNGLQEKNWLRSFALPYANKKYSAIQLKSRWCKHGDCGEIIRRHREKMIVNTDLADYIGPHRVSGSKFKMYTPTEVVVNHCKGNVSKCADKK